VGFKYPTGWRGKFLCEARIKKEHSDKRTKIINCGLQTVEWMEREIVV
jgi:hypothetical protein